MRCECCTKCPFEAWAASNYNKYSSAQIKSIVANNKQFLLCGRRTEVEMLIETSNRSGESFFDEQKSPEPPVQTQTTITSPFMEFGRPKDLGNENKIPIPKSIQDQMPRKKNRSNSTPPEIEEFAHLDSEETVSSRFMREKNVSSELHALVDSLFVRQAELRQINELLQKERTPDIMVRWTRIIEDVFYATFEDPERQTIPNRLKVISLAKQVAAFK